MSFNPNAMGQPHPSFGRRGMWVYETPSIGRLPVCRILFEIVPSEMVVHLWSADFP